MRAVRAVTVTLAAAVLGASAPALAADRLTVFPSATGFRDAGNNAIRGITVGPIENAYHPGRGYGSNAYVRTVLEAKAMGATWVALTPFGRVGDLKGRGIDPTFEAPFAENRVQVAASVALAHTLGLRVMIVPHLWVESGEWRALVDPGTDAAWENWAKSYERYVLAWAKVAEESGVDLFSVGVEMRGWVTSQHAPRFLDVIRQIRGLYKGPLTYSGNWDDIDDTCILGAVDVIGINAFYPLADKDGSGWDELAKGGVRVREKVHALADRWQKPVLFTEIGYTTRPNPAIKPWEWPDGMKNVTVDGAAQALAYTALLHDLLDEPRFAGFFVWRTYADPDDVSQEAEWGFNPRGKAAELVVRDAFATRWAGDGDRSYRWGWRAATAGLLPWWRAFSSH
jgi:hypothetical protein